MTKAQTETIEAALEVTASTKALAGAAGWERGGGETGRQSARRPPRKKRPTVRAERLSVTDFAALSDKLSGL